MADRITDLARARDEQRQAEAWGASHPGPDLSPGAKCGYRNCPELVEHVDDNPEISMCSWHLLRAHREYEALLDRVRWCHDHEQAYPTGQKCPGCAARG
jgi:hypothetical protein